MADNKDKKVLNVPALRFPEFTGEWERHKLSEVCSFYSGGTPSSSKKEYYNGNIPFIRSGELHKDYTELFITEAGLSNSAAKLVETGDLLLALYGATSGDIAISKIKGAINQAILCIRTKQNKKFIESVWNKHVERLLQTYLQGGQGNLSADIVKNIPFYFANSNEQDKLAKFISLLDERIATQNKIIEDLRLLRDAISVCLLSPKSDWKCYKVSEIADIGRGRVISSKEIANQNNPQYPVYSSQTSNEGVMGYLDNYAFDGEYITWTTDGANAGTVFYRNGRFNCTNVCGTLKLHYQFDAYYCSLVLANATKKYVSVNLANPKLMNNTMAAIKLYLPPFQEQKRMAQLFRKMDENITLEHKLLLSYQKQKHYLLQQMFI